MQSRGERCSRQKMQSKQGAPMIPRTTTVDMHCHSAASELSKLGIQRALGLPECGTPPEEVYELAKCRGMDFVTITDHDTIDGCLEIADRPDVFISEELTTWFRGRGTAPATAPSPPRRAVPRVGGSQRLACRRAQHAGCRLHRDPWRDRDRGVRRPRRCGHRTDVYRGAPR